jgi:hypothetical protein
VAGLDSVGAPGKVAMGLRRTAIGGAPTAQGVEDQRTCAEGKRIGLGATRRRIRGMDMTTAHQERACGGSPTVMGLGAQAQWRSEGVGNRGAEEWGHNGRAEWVRRLHTPFIGRGGRLAREWV